jgi:hypothetical protein
VFVAYNDTSRLVKEDSQEPSVRGGGRGWSLRFDGGRRSTGRPLLSLIQGERDLFDVCREHDLHQSEVDSCIESTREEAP